MQARVWSGVVLVAAGLALGACRREPPPRPVPPVVTVSRPAQATDVPEWDEYTGRLESVEMVQLRARVTGYIEAVPMQEGTVVKKGDVLFEIDARPFQAQLEAAQGALIQAQANLAVARDNLRRGEAAFKNKAMTEEELDQRRQTVLQSEGAVTTARANVESARLNVEWCRVTAPITGRVSSRYVTAGNLVTGGAGQGTLLTTITSLDPIYCYFDVEEQRVLRYQDEARKLQEKPGAGSRTSEPPTTTTAPGLRSPPLATAPAPAPATESGTTRAADSATCTCVGIPVLMEIAGEKSFRHRGAVDFVDNRVNPQTGTLRLRAAFANPDAAMLPGMYARLRVLGGRYARALLVPDEAIGSDQARRYVLVVGPDGLVQYRRVTLGPLWEGLRIVESGLGPGDRVVINGLMRARPGVKVQAHEGPMPRAQTEPSNMPFPTSAPAGLTPPATAAAGPGGVGSGRGGSAGGGTAGGGNGGGGR